MKITYKSLFLLLDAFATMAALTGVKFGRGISKNNRKIQQEFDDCKAGVELSDNAKAHNELHQEMLLKMCKRDETTQQPIFEVVGGVQKFTFDNEDELNLAIGKLNLLHPLAIKEKEEKQAEWNALMDEEIEFDFHMIEESLLPEAMTLAQIDSLHMIIKDDVAA